MPLYGTLRSMPLRDLLLWVAQGRTGTLLVERDRVRRWVVFRDGRIVACSSDAPPERLGHFLLAQGRISEDQLRHALGAQETSGKPLGRLFVEMGALTDAELTTHLQAQAEESLLALFDWAEAVFRFHEEIGNEPGFPVNLEVEEMVRRGEERLVKLTRIREAFPDHQVVLRPGAEPPPEPVLQNPMARQLYDAIDGHRTIAEILLHVHGSEFMVTRFLYELHRAGFIEVVRATAAAAAPRVGAVGVAAAARGATPGRGPVAQAAPAAVPPAPLALLDLPVAAGAAEHPPEADDALDAPLDDLDWDADPLDEHSEILDIPDVFAQSSDVEAIEDSIPHQVDLKLEKVRQHLASGNYEAGLVLLDELYRRFPEDDSLRRMMAEAEASFKDKAYRHYVPAHMIPSIKTPLAELESKNLSPTEFFLLSRIDGTWDVKSIIQVAPIREVEALLTLKRMREQGVIELREPAGRTG